MSSRVTQQERQDISGVWVQGIDEKTDPALGDPATHGTFTRSIYLRLVHAATDDAAGGGSGADYRMLYVFNEAGELARFAWNEHFAISGVLQGAWVSSNDWLTFHGDATSLGGTERSLSIAPNLALRPPSDAAVPESFSDTGCPMAFGTPTIDRKPTPVAGNTPNPFGELNADMPSEYITIVPKIHPKDPLHLSWCQRNAAGDDVIEIELLPADVMSRDDDPHVDASQTWNDVFHGTYPQADAVFVGYKPAEVDLYNGVTSATYPEMWDQQQMSGRRIFEYTKRSSTDFAKSRCGDGKFLALGTVCVPIGSGENLSSTVTIATENEHCESTALTLGLKGGVGEAVKASLSSTQENKTEQKDAQQFRYTRSSETFKKFALVRHLPNLTLAAEYTLDLYSLFSKLLSAPKLTLPDTDWAGQIEGTYGSHYANAATFGAVKYLKTTLTEQTEGFLAEQKIKLKAAASVAFDGYKGGPSVDVASTWGSQFTNTIEHDDLSEFYVGEHADPAAIFLDLRPANELLNPILLPWSADPLASTEQIQAPFMWYLLRQSWLDYQRRTHQIDASISALPDQDWSPKIVRFHAAVTVNIADSGPFSDYPTMYGRITWTPYGSPVVGTSNGYYRSATQWQKSANGTVPGTENVFCTLVADSTTSAAAGVGLQVSLANHRTFGPDDPFNITSKMPMNGANGEVYNGDDTSGDGVVHVKLWREIIPPST